MKKNILIKIIYAIIVFLIVEIVALTVIYIFNKNRINLMHIWSLNSYQLYLNDELKIDDKNIINEYLDIQNNNKLSKCDVSSENDKSCFNGTYKLKGSSLIVDSDISSLSGEYVYQIKDKKLILTKINDTTKEIYTYILPEG